MSLEPNLLCGSVRTRWRLLLTSNSYILLTSHGLAAPFCTTHREIVQKVCVGNPTTNKNVVTIYVNEKGERIQKMDFNKALTEYSHEETLPKALRTQVLTALTSNFVLVVFVQ